MQEVQTLPNTRRRSLGTFLDVAGSVYFVKGHPEVTVVRHVRPPSELHVGSHGEGLQAGMLGRPDLDLGALGVHAARAAVAHGWQAS